LGKARIMVVEDEGVVALQIKDTLENLGYNVPAVALSGEEAVAKITNIEPDLVLMDIQLKGELSGIQAAKRIHGAFEVPVVYLTAYSDAETLEMAELTEPYGYVLKPFEEKSLHAVIQMALFKSRRIKMDQENQLWVSAIPSSLSEAVVICDSKGQVKFANQAAETLLGLAKKDVFEKRLYDVVNLVDSLTKEKVKIPVSEPLAEGRSVVRNYHLLASDGKEIPVEFSASPLRSIEGTLFGILYVFRQTTERERIQKLVISQLEELSKLQKRILPPRNAVISGIRFDYAFHSTAFGGGCTLGFLPLTDTLVAFYALDVIEQGVLSALFSLILRTFLSPESDRGGILINPRAKDPGRKVLSPSEVVKELTRRFYLGGDSNPYFTLAYGILDTVTGLCRLVRAGYPPPLLLKKDSVRTIKPEGYAIGLFPEMDMPVEEFRLENGERLVLSSDGLIDCTDPQGNRFTAKKLTELLESTRGKQLSSAVDAIDQALVSWRSADHFEDDVSLLVIERE
jgi:PAS domain S-box-containing protein